MREKAERCAEKTSLFNHMQKTIGDVLFSKCSKTLGDYPIHIISSNPQTSCFPDHIKDYMALQEHI